MVTYSHSAVGAFHACLYKYDVLYNRRVQLKSQRHLRLDSGVMFHRMMQRLLLAQRFDLSEPALISQMDGYMQEQDDQYLRIVTDLVRKGAMEEYIAWAKADVIPPVINMDYVNTAYHHSLIRELAPIAMRGYAWLMGKGYQLAKMPDGTPCIEMDVACPIEGTGDEYKGRIDCILIDMHGQWTIVDFKLRASSIRDDYTFDFDRQTALYQYAFRQQTGIAINSIAIFQVVQATPRMPAITKEGRVARHKIVSTYDMYLQAIIDNNEDPVDYSDMLDYYRNKKYEHMHSEYRSDEAIGRNWLEFLANIDIMRLVQNNGSGYPRNFDYGCGSCPINTFCMFEYIGADTSTLVEE